MYNIAHGSGFPMINKSGGKTKNKFGREAREINMELISYLFHMISFEILVILFAFLFVSACCLCISHLFHMISLIFPLR